MRDNEGCTGFYKITKKMSNWLLGHVIRRDEEHIGWGKCLGRMYQRKRRDRGTREKEEGTTENKMETCKPTILGKVGLLD